MLSFDSTLQTLHARVKHLEQHLTGASRAERRYPSPPAPAGLAVKPG